MSPEKIMAILVVLYILLAVPLYIPNFGPNTPTFVAGIPSWVAYYLVLVSIWAIVYVWLILAKPEEDVQGGEAH